MPVVSVGDMSQQFISMRNGGVIKSELSRLAESLSTGRVTDVTKALDGQTAVFSGISYSLSQLDGYAQAARETDQTLSAMQSILAKVDNLRTQTANQLLLLNSSSTIAQVNEAGQAAKDTFETMVDTLNTRIADRSLMSGNAVDRSPLARAEDMLADLQTSIAPATTAADITTAIDFWFDDPAGGFATMGYLGDLGPPVQRSIAENDRVTIDVRADDPAIKDVLKAAAIAAIADEYPSLDHSTKTTLLQDAGQRLFLSNAGLTGLQSRLGYIEARVVQIQTETTAETTALRIAQNDLVLADPFETASRLQSVQLQLETHFAVTARMSQLSLLGYI